MVFTSAFIFYPFAVGVYYEWKGKETCFEIIAKQMGFTGGFIGESFVIASYSDTGTRERSGTAQPERYQWTGTGTQRNSPAIGGEKGLRKGWLDRTGRVFRSDKEKKYMKKIIELKGVLGQNVTKGNRAVIFSVSGPSYYTSKVVDVRNESKAGIEIETLNTIYRITYPESFSLAEAV